MCIDDYRTSLEGVHYLNLGRFSHKTRLNPERDSVIYIHGEIFVKLQAQVKPTLVCLVMLFARIDFSSYSGTLK